MALAPLRAKETSCRNGNPIHHVALIDARKKFRIIINYVGSSFLWIPLHVLGKGMLKVEVAYCIATGIVVEQTIKADTLARAHIGAYWRVRLQAATSTDAYHLQLTKYRMLGASIKVYICQSIQFINHNIDIIAPNASREHCDSLSFITSRHRVKLTTGHFTLHRIEMCRHSIHTSWITYKDYLTSQLIGTKMQVEHRAIIIDDKFRGSIICWY